jgi:hypothetical protein
MKNHRDPIGFVLSSLFTSLCVGAFTGVMVCLGLLGFAWWANIPTVNRVVWVYAPALAFGVLIWLYVAWLFFTGASSPEEMWERLKDYFRYGFD